MIETRPGRVVVRKQSDYWVVNARTINGHQYHVAAARDLPGAMHIALLHVQQGGLARTSSP